MDSTLEDSRLFLPNTVYKVAHLPTLPEWPANFGSPRNAGGPALRLG
jgi:hypothetical protein